MWCSKVSEEPDRNCRTAAVGWVPLWQCCWNHFHAPSSVVWKREAEVTLQICKWQWTFLGVQCWPNNEEIQGCCIQVEICSVVRNFPYKLLYLAILRPQWLTWSACLGLFRLAVQFLSSPKKYHQKDILTFHFLKVPSSKPLQSFKKTTPLILFHRENIKYNKKLQQFLQNRKEQPWFQRTDWGGHSAAKQSVGGEAAELVLLNTEGTKSPLFILKIKMNRVSNQKPPHRFSYQSGLTSWKPKDSPSKQLL